MKFVFDKRFKFELYPEIMKCHKEYNDIVDASYEMEEKYNNGECSKEDWLQAIDKCDEYCQKVYAKCVHNEFYGKGLTICEWKTKKTIKYDDKFSMNFESLSQIDLRIIISLVEIKYGWKLPKEFYK